MLNKTILSMTLLLLLVNQGVATVSVNETVGGYRVSFESRDSTTAILKGWDIQNVHGFQEEWNDTLGGVSEFLGVATLDSVDELSSPDEISAVGVLVLNKSVNTTDTEMKIIKKISSSFMRIHDRTIDGHMGIYIESGSGPDDPDMAYGGLYWLDKTADGMATELVILVESRNESSMMKIMDTVHVEKL